ncbi:2,3-bisphosphoglycerate-dependent phosphoglycerate mutase [Beijerinckia sp. L45]|uniref:2,3-bisphosphoglycerate-dependent phosphoglycerate mutase n=1 Tax=Beijerinckia sp. L45 TaxID=1641855 RepID=UPI00131B98EB|nr:2,3-bisphosphoglycerate-dependent phosphoglycerate mutase [Beijerinckia sp. L45]
MTPAEGLLVLVRHGESTDNALNLFSGWRDPELTEKGVTEARNAGLALKAQGLVFDVAFTSTLSRAQRSLALMLGEMGRTDLPVIENSALNERDYGELSGLNKEGARAVWGSEQVHLWRKSYEAVPPGGESLAMTAARALPFCRKVIDPRLRRGEHVLVVAHGNSLRSIVKDLDGLSDDDVESVHIGTSQILTYAVDTDGRVVKKGSMLVAV